MEDEIMITRQGIVSLINLTRYCFFPHRYTNNTISILLILCKEFRHKLCIFKILD